VGKGKKIGIGIGVGIGVSIGAIIVIFASVGISQEIEQRKALENVEISFDGVNVKDIGFSGATLDLVFRMYNPNDITATLDRADYDLYLNGNYLGMGQISKRVDITAFTSRTVPTEFDLSFGGVAQSLISALIEGETTWRVSGTAYYDTLLGTINVPFDFTR